MRKSKELLILRYLLLIVLVGQVLLISNGKSWINIVLILLLIINNNLRIFYIKKEKAFYLSIFFEILFGVLMSKYIGGTLLLYMFGAIIDVFSLKNEYIKYGFLISIYMCIISLNFKVSNNKGFKSSIVLMGIYIFMVYISKLYRTKFEAQNLYDKLRISENKLKEANEELEEYAETVEELAILKERNRISREIHDSVGHTLSTAMIQLSAMERIGEKDGHYLGGMAKNLREFIGTSFTEVKRAVRELKPEEYENFQGIIRIVEVCRNFEKLSGVKVKVSISKEKWSLSGFQNQNLYRITQEVLSNALRHGKATQVNIIINFMEDKVIVSFKDNGVGSAEIKETGLGLRGIRERIEELEGTVNMSSEEGKGFFIKLAIPKVKEEAFNGEN